LNDERITIRKADEDDGEIITKVALLSKAHWGYDQGISGKMHT
jgi:hypothetical protein